MRRGPAVLRVIAAAAWGVTAVTAVTGFDGDPRVFSALDERIWLCVLAAAIVSSLAALQQEMAGKAARVVTAVTRTAITRPPCDGPPTGPIPAVRALAPYRQPGRHAIPGQRRA